ncbi:MAG: AMP-binding protein [Planctomycetota bacterium]
MSIHWPIIRNLARHAGREMVVDDKRSYKGIEILVAAFHVASEIEKRCESETVGLLLPTSGATPIAALASWMLGKTVVPLNYLLKPEELRAVIEDCGTDTVVTVQPMLEFVGERPDVPHVIRLEDIDFKSVPELRWPATARDEDLAVLLYTSGTSGLPKGVMLSHGNLKANIAQCIEHAKIDDHEVFLGVLPQFHSFGITVLTLTPLTIGAKAVYAARFVPTKILQLFKQHHPTIFVAIPSMYNALLAMKSGDAEDFSSLRLTISGGEPLPHATFVGFQERFGKTINEGYGLTETAPVTNLCCPIETREHSVGRALPRIVQRIRDLETGRELPPGEEGEITMQGPNIMQGYFRKPSETDAVLSPEGEFRTGDIGRLDADGFLYITGRLKEMIIVGGENVFPREIEEVLNTHPDVQASAVVGQKDPVRGELPVAFVEATEGASFDEDTLRGFCRDRLAGYKVPRWVRQVAELPRNPTGKIMRRELATMADADAVPARAGD